MSKLVRGEAIVVDTEQLINASGCQFHPLNDKAEPADR